MKKSNFTALILGTVGIVFFALGMCMALVEEWGLFRKGIIAGVAGLIILLITVIVWRRMEGKSPALLDFPSKPSGGTTMAVCWGRCCWALACACAWYLTK